MYNANTLQLAAVIHLIDVIGSYALVWVPFAAVGADGSVFLSTVDSVSALSLLLWCIHVVLCNCMHA